MKPAMWMMGTAVAMAAVFGVLHLLGGRESVGMLSGTLDGGPHSLVLGVLYTLSWFDAVLLVPILLLAGLARAVLGRTVGARQGEDARHAEHGAQPRR